MNEHTPHSFSQRSSPDLSKEPVTKKLPAHILENRQQIEAWLNATTDANLPPTEKVFNTENKSIDPDKFKFIDGELISNNISLEQLPENIFHSVTKIGFALHFLESMKQEYGLDFLTHEFSEKDFKMGEGASHRKPITITNFIRIMLDVGVIVREITNMDNNNAAKLFTNPALQIDSLRKIYEKNEAFRKNLSLNSSEIR